MRRIPQVTPLWDFSLVPDELIESSADPEVLRMLCWRGFGYPNADKFGPVPHATASQLSTTAT
jgi:hypothetical protein